MKMKILLSRRTFIIIDFIASNTVVLYSLYTSLMGIVISISLHASEALTHTEYIAKYLEVQVCSC